MLDDLLSKRIHFFEVALSEFTNHPVLGIGSFNVKEFMSIHVIPDKQIEFLGPHNFVIYSMFSMGLAGTVFLLFGLVKEIFLIVVECIKGNKLISICLVSIVSSYLIGALIEDFVIFHMTFVRIYFWFILGFLINVRLKSKEVE